MATCKKQSIKPTLSCQGPSGQNPNLHLLPVAWNWWFTFRARGELPGCVCRAWRESPGLGEEHRSSARSLLQPGLGSLSEQQQQWELPGDGQSCSLCTSAPRPERSRASGLAGCIKNLHFRLGFIPHCSASNQSLCYHTTSAQEKPSRSLLLIKGRLLKGRLLCCAV